MCCWQGKKEHFWRKWRETCAQDTIGCASSTPPSAVETTQTPKKQTLKSISVPSPAHFHDDATWESRRSRNPTCCMEVVHRLQRTPLVSPPGVAARCLLIMSPKEMHSKNLQLQSLIPAWRNKSELCLRCEIARH